MNKNAILLSLFAVLLVNWLMIIYSVRVYVIPFSEPLSLLGVMPLNFQIALFFLILLTFLSVYLKKHHFSIVFAVLFSLYFHITPWIVEPLRVNDTLFHYSRTAAINNLGFLPTIGKYYFDFPGSAIFGSSLLSITGFDYLIVLKYFPVLSLFVFQLGLSTYLYKFQGLRYVGLGLLFSSILGWGGYPLSPEAMGRMFLPLLLYLLMKPRKASYTLGFMVLAAGLTISHPTTAVFLTFVLFAYVIAIEALDYISHRYSPFKGNIVVSTFFLIVLFFSWAMSVSPTISIHFSGALRTLIAKLFNPQEAQQALVQPAYPLFGVSLANYVFIALSAILSIIILLKAANIFIKRRIFSLNPRRCQKLIGLTMIFVGLMCTPIFFISGYGQYALTTAAAFAFLGTSMSLEFFNLGSKKVFCALMIFALLLVVPSFISNHAYDYYNLNRDPIRNGLMYTGQHIYSENVRIICPFGNQLWAFLNYDMWDQVISIYPFWGTTGEPVQYQGQRGDYFIYRSDGNIYASLQCEGGVPLNETSYSKIRTELLNSSNFDIIYSSNEFEILVYPP